MRKKIMSNTKVRITTYRIEHAVIKVTSKL